MNEIHWYYAREDQRFGPVVTAELKRLAEHGQIGPGDLVWREGMTDWIEAAKVKGLFHQGPPEPPPAPGGAQPVRAEAPPVQTEVARQKASFRHPVEIVLSLTRLGASEAFVDSSIRLFALVGHWAVVAAMGLLVVAGAAVSVHAKTPWAILGAVAMVPVLAVLQYAAARFCEALDRVNRSTRAAIASTALVDLMGIVSMLAGLILLFAIAAEAMTSLAYPLVLAALLAFVVCEHLAAVCFSHVDQNVIVSDNLSPGEEALGTLCAVLKASARLVPVAFGAGVCGGALLLVVACVYCLRGSEALAAGHGAALAGTAIVAASAALPMLGYLLFLLFALVFDVLDGLLTLRHNEER